MRECACGTGDGRRFRQGGSAIPTAARSGARFCAALVAALVACPAAGAQGPVPGLVAAYGFDEGAGTTVADASGLGNAGTIAGASWTTQGRFGGGLAFDGVNDSISVPDAPSLDLTTGMTLEAWAFPTTLAARWRTVLFKERAGNLVYGLYANRNTSVPTAEATIGGSVRGVVGGSQIPLNAWTHLAATYDGTMLRLFVNASQVGQLLAPGSIAVSTGLLKIGGNGIWGEWFIGVLDEIRVYNRALTVEELVADQARGVTTEDTAPPTAPEGFRVTTVGATTIGTAWDAATDDVAVAGYALYRDGAPAGTTTATSFTFSGLQCGTTYELGVETIDAATKRSERRTLDASTEACDVTPPSVAVTAPASGTVVTGTVTVQGNADDDRGVAGVQFLLDASALGPEDTAAPYSAAWSTAASTAGGHVLTATARDAAGNRTTSAPVAVTVHNPSRPAPGLVAAYGFDESSGTAVADASGLAHTGTISGATRVAAGRHGRALSFDGVNDSITIADTNALDLSNGMTLEAWVRPTSTALRWRTVLFKERPGNLSYGLYASRNTGFPTAELMVSSSSKRGVVGTAALPVNTWTHLAATYDGAVLRLYADAVQIGQLVAAGSIPASSGPLRIGGNAIWGEWFLGQLDEVRVYNRPLSALELGADMARPVWSPPSQPALTLAETLPDTFASGTTLFRRPGAAGAFTVSAATEEPDFGVDRVVFPDVGGTAGGDDTSTPYAHSYTWTGATAPTGTFAVTAVGATTLTSSSTFEVVPDGDAPTGPSLGVASGYDADGIVGLAVDPGVDSGAGVDPARVLPERATAVLSEGVCGAFGPWTATGPDEALASGLCAHYRLRVADRVGNEATVDGTGAVTVDLSPPAVGDTSVAEDDPSVHAVGTDVFYNPATPGSFAVSVEASDPESGVVEVVFPEVFGGDGAEIDAAPYEQTYVWEEGSVSTGPVAAVAVNRAGSSSQAVFAVQPDGEAPTGGSVEYQSGPDDDGVVHVEVDHGVDAGAGVDPASLRLEREVGVRAGGSCGAFGPWETDADSSPLAPGTCARYRIQVADRVGNGATFTSPAVAWVEGAAPAAADLALTLAENAATEHANGSTLFYAPTLGASGSFTVTAFPPGEVDDVRFPDVFGGDGGIDSEPPFARTYAWTDVATAGGAFAVDGRVDGVVVAAGSFAVVRDVEAPVGGSVVYDEGFDADGVVTVAASPGVDALSGLDESATLFERQTASLEADGDCAEFGSFVASETTNVVPEATCAKYRLRAFDQVGNRITHRPARVVKVDTAAPSTPGSLAATTASPTELAVAWDPAADAVGVVGYWVARDGQRIGATAGTAYDLGWLDCETTYALTVVALDAAGNTSVAATTDATTAACPAPSPADAYISPLGSDDAACTQSDPCLSLDRAYRAVPPGGEVEIGAGRYVEQTIWPDDTKSEMPVLFRPAAGRSAVFDELSVSASHVVVRGIGTVYATSPGGSPVQAGVAVDRGSTGVTLEDVDAGHVWVGGDVVRIVGGDYGPTVDDVSKVTGTSAVASLPPRDVLIDGARFHDYLRETRHMECLTLSAADGVTIRNSVFNNCAVFAIFLKEFGESDLVRNVLIENNRFANTLSIAMSAMIKITTNASLVPCNDVLIRNNTIVDKLVLSNCPGSVRWESNVFESLPAGVCEDRGAGNTFDFNVIEEGSACGPNDHVVAGGDTGLSGRRDLDLHLLPGSAAMDRGNPASFPAFDFEGDTRPQGLAPDAGADEAG